MSTINYLWDIDCNQKAVNRNELQARLQKWQEKAYKSLPIFQFIEINLQSWQNNTNTEITFEGACGSKVIAKQEDTHSTVPTDKQIKKEILQSTTTPVQPISRETIGLQLYYCCTYMKCYNHRVSNRKSISLLFYYLQKGNFITHLLKMQDILFFKFANHL